MKSFIRNLSAPAEFCFIVLLAFGVPLTGSLLVIYRQLMHVEASAHHFDNHYAITLLLTETVILAVVIGIGRVRGWAGQAFRFGVTWRGTIVGLLLYGAATAAYIMARKFFPPYSVPTQAHLPVSLGGILTLPFIILNSLTNPVFEEMLEAGYVITALQKFGPWPAILAGALLRSFLHVYLGVAGAVTVFATGVLFGLVYWRWRQLWPLIVAHALLDFLGLLHVNMARLLHLA